MYKAISYPNCSYYAYRAGLNKREENRTKLHVNTKRPIYFDPDKFYAVIRFIDFDEDLFDQSTKGRRFRIPDIGVIVVSPELERKNLIKIKRHFFKPSTLQYTVQFSVNKKYSPCDNIG